MILTSPTEVDIDSEIIVTLAKQALHNLPFRKKYFDAYHYNEFQREFATVRIGLPRQSGHSTAALQLLYEYPDSLIFLPGGTSRDYMRSQLKQWVDDLFVFNRMVKNIKVLHQAALEDIKPVSDRPFIIFDEMSSHRAQGINEVKASLNAKIILELQ